MGQPNTPDQVWPGFPTLQFGVYELPLITAAPILRPFVVAWMDRPIVLHFFCFSLLVPGFKRFQKTIVNFKKFRFTKIWNSKWTNFKFDQSSNLFNLWIWINFKLKKSNFKKLNRDNFRIRSFFKFEQNLSLIFFQIQTKFEFDFFLKSYNFWIKTKV
jgi:hypothetical protein